MQLTSLDVTLPLERFSKFDGRLRYLPAMFQSPDEGADGDAPAAVYVALATKWQRTNPPAESQVGFLFSFPLSPGFTGSH